MRYVYDRRTRRCTEEAEHAYGPLRTGVGENNKSADLTHFPGSLSLFAVPGGSSAAAAAAASGAAAAAAATGMSGQADNIAACIPVLDICYKSRR